MVSGSSVIVTNVMKNVFLERAFSSSPLSGAYVSGAIGTSSGVALVTDTALGSIVSGWAGGDYKGYETGYPVFDVTNKTVQTRMFVSSAQGNGNTISEYADFTSTGQIGGRFTFNGIAKTSSIQIFINTKYKML